MPVGVAIEGTGVERLAVQRRAARSDRHAGIFAAFSNGSARAARLALIQPETPARSDRARSPSRSTAR